MFSIYVRPFGPFVWLISKNHTASSSCAKVLNHFAFAYWRTISTVVLGNNSGLVREPEKPKVWKQKPVVQRDPLVMEIVQVFGTTSNHG